MRRKTPTAITPLLMLVHGTGAQAHESDEEYLEPLNYDAHAAPGRSDVGERWWQVEGSFYQALAERIRTIDGHALTDPGTVYRLKWSGANKESARDAGADSFAHLFRGAAPRRVHVIAHSHGGNVARTGIERLAREAADLGRIGTVVSMGTPFFVYSWLSVLGGVAWKAASGGMLAGLAWLAFYGLWLTDAEEHGITDAWQWVLIPVALISALLALVLIAWAVSLAERPTKGRRLPGGQTVAWTNLCSRNDEAVQLLRSLDRRVGLFGRTGKQASAGLIWAAVVFAMFVTVEMATNSIVAALGWTSGWAGLGASMAAVMLTYALLRILWEVLSQASAAGRRLLDGMVTGRLRGLAYGDDTGAGMAGVRTVPWEGNEIMCQPLSETVEAAIEAHVARTSVDLWARTRRAIKPDASFLDVNFRYLIDEVLTGDELSHTVYYRIEEFVDLVADLLVETGDYVRL